MRTTRLLAVMMELSRVPRTTVRHLADRHGVSTRTIQRDLAALNELGVPVWTRTGPAGGVGLVDGWSSPVTGMTATELQALIIGEAGSRDLGLQDHFGTARLKMLSTTTARSPGVGQASERFLIDHERWFTEPDHPAALPAVSRAVWSGRRLTMGYSRHGAPRADGNRSGASGAVGAAPTVSLLVDPLGLVLKTDVWYLVAAHRHRVRTYRLSRITTARVNEEAAWQPDGFDLAEYWERSKAAFESSVCTLPARFSLPAAATDALLAAVPGPATAAALAQARNLGGRLEVELLMETPGIAVAQLLQVPGIEVHEPQDLRRFLGERGQDLAARNSQPS